MRRKLPAAIRLSVALYGVLLLLYPRAHRREFGGPMGQLFDDLCRDAYNRQGLPGLRHFWRRIVLDLARSAPAAHLEAAKEMIMAVDRTIKPLPWLAALLVVVPGLSFALARAFYPLGWLLTIGVLPLTALAALLLVARKGLPAWGLLPLGLISFTLLGFASLFVAERLAYPYRLDYSTRQMLLALPLWLAIAFLAWRYRHCWPFPLWSLLLPLAFLVAAAIRFGGFGGLHDAGWLLLPIALGLSLAPRHGAYAVLFPLGAYLTWFLDADSYGAYTLRDHPLFPLYVFLLFTCLFVLAPLLLVRARSWAGRALGLLAPVALALSLRVLVPWLTGADFHPPRIWLGETALSSFLLLLLALAFVLYTRLGEAPATPPNASATSHVAG